MARLAVLFVTAFVDMVGITMIIPILPYYAADLGASGTVVGVVISAFSLAQLLTAPSWGRLSDGRGRRPAVVGGLIVTAAGYVLFALAGSIWVLLLSRLVQGVGGGTIGVIHAYVADVSAPEDRTKSLGWLSAVTSLGAVAGPAIGSLLVRAGGVSLPGWVAAAFVMLVAGFGWGYLREPRRPAGHTGEHRVPGAEAMRTMIARPQPPAARLIWLYAIGIGAFYGIIPLVPLLLEERFGITAETVGYFIMYLGGIGVLMRLFALGPLAERLGEPRLARFGLVALALGLATTGLGFGWPLLALGFTLMPVGTACLFPATTSLLSQVVTAVDRGMWLGLQQTWGGITRVSFPILGGLIIDVAGVGTPFVIAGVLLLALGLPLIAGVRPRAERAAG